MDRRKFLAMLGLAPVAAVASQHLPVAAEPSGGDLAAKGAKDLSEAVRASYLTMIINGGVDPVAARRAELQARRSKQALQAGPEQYRKYLTERLHQVPRYSDEFLHLWREREAIPDA